MVIIKIFFLVLLIGCSTPAKRIAISFDDAPNPDTYFLKSNERALLIRSKLKKKEVPAVGFFVNGSKINKNNRDLISDYDLDGHIIANHGYRHLDLRKTKIRTYLKDISRNHNVIKNFSNFRPWFRFPYLREGDTAKKRDIIRKGLEKLGYKNGYVTIDNYDWAIDLEVRRLAEKRVKVPMRKVRQLYLNHIWESIQFYDDIAVKGLERDDVAHVLLLHENDLAAFFIDDLVEMIRDKGWEIISIDEAYQDPLFDYEPNNLEVNQGRVVGAAVDKGYKGSLRQKTESRKYWKRKINNLTKK